MLKIVAILLVLYQANFAFAVNCVNPSNQHFNKPLNICVSQDDSICLGISPGDQLNERETTTLEHEFVTFKSKAKNDEKQLTDEKLPWQLYCDEASGHWSIRHSYFHKMCIYQREPKKSSPCRRFLTMDVCPDSRGEGDQGEPDHELLRVSVEKNSDTGLYHLNMFNDPAIERNYCMMEDSFCLAIGECKVDERENCDTKVPWEVSDLEPGHLAVMAECPSDVSTSTSFFIVPASPNYTDHATSRPTPAPTNKPTRSPTMKPTNKPTHSPTPAPTNKPSHSPTPAPTNKPTHSPTMKPTKKPTHHPTKAPTITTSSPTKSPEAVDSGVRPGDNDPSSPPLGSSPNPGTVTFVIFLVLVLLMFLYTFRRRLTGWRHLASSDKPFLPEQIARGGIGMKFQKNGLTTISLDEDAPLINI